MLVLPLSLNILSVEVIHIGSWVLLQRRERGVETRLAGTTGRDDKYDLSGSKASKDCGVQVL